MEKFKVLSLDISAASTGWSFSQSNGKFKYGLIKTDPKQSRSKRLVQFRVELSKLLTILGPTHVVIEDIFLGLNPKTLVMLSKFAGVAEELCLSVIGVEPYIIHTNTVKAFFKATNKEDIFNIIVCLLELEEEFKFSKHNDLTDSIAQLLCYCDSVLECKKFKFEKEYGYLYEV